MRRVTMFVGSMAAVLALGAAVAFAAGPLATVASQTESDPVSASNFFGTTVGTPTDDKPAEEPAAEPKAEDPVEEPADEKPKDEAPAEEPADEKPAEEPVEESKEEEPADTTPPEIVILHPTDGQVFETDRIAFEGEAEPGARIFAGDWEADVSENGAWRIVLILQPGSNIATITAIDAAGNEGKDRVQVFYEAGKEEPVSEPPKEEEPPKDEKPKDEEHVKGFTAYQLYGTCGEEIPYDVFYGSGVPGTTVTVTSDFGTGSTTIGEHGEWELKVEFPSAPHGQKFGVLVTSSDGHVADFWFKATGDEH